MLVSLGKVTVSTPGQPVRLTSNLDDPTANYYVHGFAIQRLKDNTGDIYVSLSSTDDRTNMRQLLARLWSGEPSYAAGIGIELNGTNLADVYIDADEADDGVTACAMIS